MNIIIILSYIYIILSFKYFLHVSCNSYVFFFSGITSIFCVYVNSGYPFVICKHLTGNRVQFDLVASPHFKLTPLHLQRDKGVELESWPEASAHLPLILDLEQRRLAVVGRAGRRRRRRRGRRMTIHTKLVENGVGLLDEVIVSGDCALLFV